MKQQHHVQIRRHGNAVYFDVTAKDGTIAATFRDGQGKDGTPTIDKAERLARELSPNFETLIGQSSTAIHAAMMRDPYQARYLWYVPASSTTPGTLHAVPDETDPPEGAQLATPERIPGHLTRDGLQIWILAIARRLPILPYKP